MPKLIRKATGRPKLVETDNTIRVGFTVPEKFWTKIIEQADAEGVTYSNLIRRALLEYMTSPGLDDGGPTRFTAS